MAALVEALTDPNVTGRYPTPYAAGGPKVTRLVFLGLIGANANGVGMADVVSARLARKMDRPATYMNALTSTEPFSVKLSMVMPTDRLAVLAVLRMCAGVKPSEARLVRIKNTTEARRMWVSEVLLARVEEDERLRVVGPARPIEFDPAGRLV